MSVPIRNFVMINADIAEYELARLKYYIMRNDTKSVINQLKSISSIHIHLSPKDVDEIYDMYVDGLLDLHIIECLIFAGMNKTNMPGNLFTLYDSTNEYGVLYTKILDITKPMFIMSAGLVLGGLAIYLLKK